MFAKSSYTCRLRQKQQQKKALNETAAMPLMGQMEVGATIFVQRCYENDDGDEYDVCCKLAFLKPP